MWIWKLCFFLVLDWTMHWSYQESFLVVILNPIDLSLSWIRKCGVPFFPFHFSILSTKSVWVKILPYIHFSPNTHFSFCFIAFWITRILKFKLSKQFREFGGKMTIFGILDSSRWCGNCSGFGFDGSGFGSG